MPRARERDSLDEDPQPGDQDSTDEPDMVPCPFCKAEISEMAEVCPECGSYVVDDREGRPLRARLTRIIVTVLIIVLALCLMRLR